MLITFSLLLFTLNHGIFLRNEGFQYCPFKRSITRHWEETCAELVHYDVISFTETWLSPIVIDRLISLDGYTMMGQDRDIQTQKGRRKRGGGLVIYVWTVLQPYTNVVSNECQNSQNSEELWMNICKPRNKKSVIGLIYVDNTLSSLIGTQCG